MPDWNERKAVRALFVLALVALPIQSAVILVAGEPWPAVMLPSFGSVPGGKRGAVQMETEFVVHFDDASTDRITRFALLEQAPRSHHGAIVNRNFRRKQMGKAPEAGRDRYATPSQSPEAVEWLRGRLASLYPDRRPTAMDVVWTQEQYRFRKGRLVNSGRTVLDTLTIPLDG